jgi:uncharacterized protein YqeY
MPSLVERLQMALNEARKARDQHRTLLFSTVLADLKNREFEVHHPLTDEDAVDVVRRGIKKRREAVEQFTKVGRQDRADVEQREVVLLEGYLPAQVPPDEIRAAVRVAIAAGASDLGKVMGQVMPQFKGRADGKVINQIVREELSASV